MAPGGAASASSMLFVYSLDYAQKRLVNDAKSSKKGGGVCFPRAEPVRLSMFCFQQLA
jgi:hypothetical protein